MAAFTGYDPIDAEREKSKYGSFDPGNLQRLDPRNAPAADAAASRGALPPGQPQGAAPALSTAFAAGSGDEGKGAGGARKPQQEKNQFFEMWKEGNEEDRMEVAKQQEQMFSSQGLSLEGATKKLFEEGGEVAARLGAKYGIVPPADKQGMPAFKPTEQALADYEGKLDEKKQEKTRQEKKAAMGGFLMEMGLRILASQRDDAGGAIAEGALGTIGARRNRKAAAKEAGIAEAERKRQADLEERAQTVKESAEERKGQEAEKPDLAQITDKDGNVIYVEEKAGYVTDKGGKRIRKATDAELTRSQREINRRARTSDLQSTRRAVQKLVDAGYSDDPEITAIIEEEDPDKRRKMVAEVARKRVESIGNNSSGGDVVDYSSL